MKKSILTMSKIAQLCLGAWVLGIFGPSCAAMDEKEESGKQVCPVTELSVSDKSPVSGQKLETSIVNSQSELSSLVGEFPSMGSMRERWHFMRRGVDFGNFE